jgi:hypothetical protein
MDEGRKYSQRGYQESDRSSSGQGGGRNGEGRNKQQGPRPPLDVTGPRLPWLVQSVVASRCFQCSTALPASVDFKGACPKCNAPLHCCKQCSHFEPSTRFQCLKPIPVRLAPKDLANECTHFSPRVTVARDAPPPSAPAPSQALPADFAKKPSDARTAFDNLFKK